MARFLPRVEGLALSYGASRSEADELARELPGHLAMPPRGGSARTRLGTYNGEAPLFAWLSVIVVQRLVDLRRGQRRAPREANDAVLEAAQVDGDPAAHLLAVETARNLEHALAEVWKRLSEREAAAFLLKYGDGLRQKEVAALLGVSESRVSKILTAGEEKVRYEVLNRFVGPLPTEWVELDLLWRALQDAIARHMERNRPSSGDPSRGSSPHGP